VQTSVTITVDTDRLSSYNDSYIAQLWHVSQANPAPFGDKDAGELAQALAFEIVQRWMHSQPIELYSHQANDFAFKQRMEKADTHTPCTQCNGAGTYRKPYSSEQVPCDACATHILNQLQGGAA
jgi:hypothetical protein